MLANIALRDRSRKERPESQEVRQFEGVALRRAVVTWQASGGMAGIRWRGGSLQASGDDSGLVARCS